MLVIDQFEEVFTQCRSPEERQAFIDSLLGVTKPDDEQPVTLLIALRADFYAQVAAFDGLREAVSQHQEFIGAMSRNELLRAIVQPLALDHWKIQEGLVEVMLNDVGYEPGALPLLSHAMLEPWKRRRGRTLTLSGYTEAGGVRGAIALTAETIFCDRLTREQQPIAQMIFIRLAELNADAQDTRRRAEFSELITRSTDEATIEAVLSILTDARLVTQDTLEPGDVKVVEVAHEALIREWPTLREWLSENRAGLILHRELADDTNTWLRLNRDPGALYRGLRLKNAAAWAEQNSTMLSLTEQEFLDTSRKVAAAETRLLRLRRLVFPIAGVVLLGILAVLFFLTGLNYRFRTPAKMSGVYNIAVAEFGTVAADGRIAQAPNSTGSNIDQKRICGRSWIAW